MSFELKVVALSSLLVFCATGCATGNAQCPKCPSVHLPVNQSASQATEQLSFATTKSVKEAQAILAGFFKGQGWTLIDDPSNNSLVIESPQGTRFGAGVPMLFGPGKLGRLEVFKAWRIKEPLDPRLKESIVTLNGELSGFLFSISTDNALVCKSWIYFIDRVDSAVLLQLMQWFDSFLLSLIAKHTPQVIPLLE